MKTALRLPFSLLLLSLSTASFAGIISTNDPGSPGHYKQTFNLHAIAGTPGQDLSIACMATTDVGDGKECANKKTGFVSETYKNGAKNFYLINNQSGSRIMISDESCTPFMKGSNQVRSPDKNLESFDIYVTVSSVQESFRDPIKVLFSNCYTVPAYVAKK